MSYKLFRNLNFISLSLYISLLIQIKFSFVEDAFLSFIVESAIVYVLNMLLISLVYVSAQKYYKPKNLGGFREDLVASYFYSVITFVSSLMTLENFLPPTNVLSLQLIFTHILGLYVISKMLTIMLTIMFPKSVYTYLMEYQKLPSFNVYKMMDKHLETHEIIVEKGGEFMYEILFDASVEAINKHNIPESKFLNEVYSNEKVSKMINDFDKLNNNTDLDSSEISEERIFLVHDLKDEISKISEDLIKNQG